MFGWVVRTTSVRILFEFRSQKRDTPTREAHRRLARRVANIDLCGNVCLCDKDLGLAIWSPTKAVVRPDPKPVLCCWGEVAFAAVLGLEWGWW